MPTISISKKELLKTLGKRLSDDQLKDRIGMLGTALEGIENDDIHVEIFPNRPDLLSQQGFSRALASFIGAKPGLQEYKVKKSGKKVIVDKSVEECRPHTRCAIVTKLKINDEKLKEIIQIQEKLHVTFGRNRKRAAIGIYPMEHIAFPITFKGLKPADVKFQPLEAKKAMTAQEILEAHPKGKDYASLVAGLSRYACFLDAKGNIMSFTPIINSELTGKITEKTTEVFIECSGFDERILEECLAMIVTAFADMGGEISSVELEYPTKKVTSPVLEPRKMKADVKYINTLLGLDLNEKTVKTLFEKMGYGYEKGVVSIPAYRTDILHQADFAEDIAIAYGFEHIPEILPNVATIAREAPFEIFAAKVRERLVGHGLLEVKNYHLISKELQTKRMNLELDVITLKSSVSEGYDSLRAWLTPSLVDTLGRNKRHEYPQTIFEIGKVFTKSREKTETGVNEMFRIAAAVSGEEADYTRIRQLLDSLFASFGVTPTYKETEHASFIPGRVARVSVAGVDVAYCGELDPKVLDANKLGMPTAVFELNLTVLYDVLRKKA